MTGPPVPLPRYLLVEQIRLLWGSGLSTKLIGDRLGVTKNVVIGIAHRANLPPRESPILSAPRTPRPPRAKPLSPRATTLPPAQEPTRDDLVALIAEGLSQAEIGVRLNMTTDQAVWRLRKHKLTVPRRPPAPRPAAQPRFEAPMPVRMAPPPRPALRGKSGCRMPLWSAQERPSHLYCDAPIARGSYCEACARRVYAERAA